VDARVYANGHPIMNDPTKPSAGRRDLLKAVALGGVVAAAVAVPLAPRADADTETKDERRKARYRLSDDVKAFYRVNRYPR
jgi:hypothetical protein